MPCSRFILRGFALAALVASGLSVAPLGGAEAAVVYCTGPGVPAGCKPSHVPVVVCKRPEVPADCAAMYPGQTMLEAGVYYTSDGIGGLVRR